MSENPDLGPRRMTSTGPAIHQVPSAPYLSRTGWYAEVMTLALGQEGMPRVDYRILDDPP